MSQTTRTVGLWLLLILLFTGFYSFFSPNNRVPSWMAVAGVVLFIAFIALVVQGKGGPKGIQLNSEGIKLLAQGRIAPALEKFEAARPLLANNWKAVIAFNIGLCQMELWRLDAAEREFSQALGFERLSKPILPQLLTRYALVAALRGEAQVARERSEKARQVDAESPLLVLTDAVLACRERQWSQAQRLLENPTTHVLGGPLRGLRDALLSWSVEHTTGEQRYIELVTVFGEASHDKLRESWPPFVDFLLTRTQAKA